MTKTQIKLLRYTTLTAGLLGMTLRAALYATGIDHKGLIVSGHWATWSVLILTGAILLFAFLTTKEADGTTAYALCFPASYLQGAFSLLAAAQILQRSIPLYAMAADRLNLICAYLGFGAALSLAALCVCRMMGKKPIFLFHSILCIFFAVQMISQYRRWSADPQLMNYCFYLFAFICLMLCAYFLATFDVGTGNHRALWFFSMAATYFCLLALPESGDSGFLIICAAWAFTCAPRIQASHQIEDSSDDHT